MLLVTPGQTIKNLFPYLFEEGQFQVLTDIKFESFGNWVVVLLSTHCRIRIMQDRSDISLAVGPLWSPPGWEAGPWYDVAVIWKYLALDPLKIRHQTGMSAERQLQVLARAFQPHLEQIFELFTEANFKSHEEELNHITTEMDNASWVDVLKG